MKVNHETIAEAIRGCVNVIKRRPRTLTMNSIDWYLLEGRESDLRYAGCEVILDDLFPRGVVVAW